MIDTDLAAKIEHTLLKPDANDARIRKLCHEAKQYRFFGVCVPPSWVSLARAELEASSCKVVTVNGFPHGNTLPNAKAAEAKQSISEGASEVDMVIQIGRLLSGDMDYVVDDIRRVAEASHECGDIVVKVIVETSYLADNLIQYACEAAEKAGADFVKTSTGFGGGGATIEAISLMRKTVGDRLGIKAAGGIKNRDAAVGLVNAGADRIGASASIEIVS